MPFVRIMIKAKLEAQERRNIADAVHRALVESIGVPVGDRFQTVECLGEDLIFDRGYLGISRSDHFIAVQIFMAFGRSVEQKKSLYDGIAQELSSHAGFRREDVFINIVEVAFENWSFGNGEAQYADKAPAHIGQA